MHKSIIGVGTLCLAACAHHHMALPFREVVNGDLGNVSRVSVDGKMDTTGINFYSLIAPSDEIGSSNCIALILSDRDQARADVLHGSEVRVRGRVFLLADLAQMIPSQRGLINGRSWSGTGCEGEVAIYVAQLTPLAEVHGNVPR